jgi:ABC-2 type transport system permease protein
MTETKNILHWKYSFLLYNLIKRDFVTKYRRSVLGVLWSVLNPLLMMCVLSVVFTNLFRFQIPHYPVYYITGSLIFNFMSEATMNALTSIVTNDTLIKKVRIPLFIFPIEKAAFSLVNTFFAFLAVLVVSPILGVPPTPAMTVSWLFILYTFVFSMGAGMLLASIYVYFRDISHLYGVFTTAWMFLTPIMYPVDKLPPVLLNLMKFNPMYHFVESFRTAALYGQFPTLNQHLRCIVMAAASVAIGSLIFNKLKSRFILYL